MDEPHDAVLVCNNVKPFKGDCHCMNDGCASAKRASQVSTPGGSGPGRGQYRRRSGSRSGSLTSHRRLEQTGFRCR
jgi:hypothetical protein